MRTALVTGATSGIGHSTAIELARRGMHIVAAGRSMSRLEDLVGAIEATGGSAETLRIDLSSLDSVRDATRTYRSSGRPVDVLVNNAGVAFALRPTVDGFQPQFGVNHLGHFMLHLMLQPLLSESGTVVQVSSEAHRRAQPVDLEGVDRPRLDVLRAYAASKLANILFVREAARRYPSRRYYAVHPGMVDTGIWPWFARPFVRGSLLSPEEGADTVVWCAAGEEDLPSGGYYLRRRQVSPSAVACDDGLARELWSNSELWCGGTGRDR
jgi:retinol dehydrogenase 12